MKYIIIGLLLSIGWQVAELFFEAVREVLFSRLHNAKWYRFMAGKEPKDIKAQPGDIKAVKNRIGFNYNQEKES